MRRLICSAMVLFLLLMPLSVVAEDASKEATYQRAVEFMESGDYDLAISIFEMLGDYKDSAAQLLACQDAKKQLYYESAVSLFEAGEYDAAKEVFLLLGTYADSEIQAIRCETQKAQDQYDEAVSLADAGRYAEAKEIFLFLGSFSDSAARAAQMDELMLGARYGEAEALEGEARYDEAAEIYAELGDYGDAAARREACEAQIRVAALSGLISEALLATPFQAADTYALLAEGTAAGLDADLLSAWYESAYAREIGDLYGEGALFLRADADADGEDEFVIAARGSLAVAEGTAQGLSVTGSVEAPDYEALSCEPDQSGRPFLIARTAQRTDVYLLAGVPALIASADGGESAVSVSFTATGFVLGEILTKSPLRTRDAEYIILSADQVITTDSPVQTDLDAYPARDTALSLLTLYREAFRCGAAEELALLAAPEADPAQLQELGEWLLGIDEIGSAEIYLWDGAAGCFDCLVTASGVSRNVSLVRDEGGNYRLLGTLE